MFYKKLFKLRSDGSLHEWQIEVQNGLFRTHSGTLGGKLVTSNWRRCVGKGRGKAATTAEEQARKEAEARYTKQLALGYYVDEESARSGADYFKPMLAHKYDDHTAWIENLLVLNRCIFVQPKLDGMRCIATPKGLFSRQGKPIISAPHIHQELMARMKNRVADWIFDGELYTNKFKDDFNAIISLAKKTKPTDEDLQRAREMLEYHIYDMPAIKNGFAVRYDTMTGILGGQTLWSGKSMLNFVPTERVYTSVEIDRKMRDYLTEGYEGLMVRTNDMYENKRSKHLLKYKTWMDDEFEILDITEGKGNRQGMAGFATMKTFAGNEFTSAFKGDLNYLRNLLEKREEFLGKMATVKFQNWTPDGVPRFPCIVAIRDYE